MKYCMTVIQAGLFCLVSILLAHGAEVYPSLKGNEQNRGNMVSKDGPLLWQSQVVGLQENPNYVTFEGKQIPVTVRGVWQDLPPHKARSGHHKQRSGERSYFS